MNHVATNGQRVMVITTGLRPLIKRLVERFNIVGLVRSSPRSEIRRRKAAQPNGLAPTSRGCNAIVRLLQGAEQSLLKYASDARIEYFEMANGCDAMFERWVKHLRPEVIVVVCMTQLLKENILRIPCRGTINIHPSLLPKYRGPNPLFWSFYDMDLHGAVTVHFLDEGEDTGDIIYQEPFEIPIGATMREVTDMAFDDVGWRLLSQAIEAVLRNENPRFAQPKESPTRRARNISRDEVFVKWENWSVRRVFHFLRGTRGVTASLPCPVNPFRSELWNTVGYEECIVRGHVPSEIYRYQGRYYVACKDGRIRLSAPFCPKRIPRILRRFASSRQLRE